MLNIIFCVSRSAPKLSCIEEFEEEDSENVAPEVPTLKRIVQHFASLQPLEEEVKTTPVNNVPAWSADEKNDSPHEETILVKKNDETSPPPVKPARRHSNSNSLLKDPEGRPNTIPMDAKLNLPYLTGYEKVMHLLNGCKSCDPLLLGNAGTSTDSGNFETYADSDPFASCSCRSSNKEDGGSSSSSVSNEQVESEKEELDNVSDESGYAEERRRSSLSSAGVNTTVKDSLKKKKEIVSFEVVNNSPNYNFCTNEEDSNHVSCLGTQQNQKPLVIYHNLSFEI